MYQDGILYVGSMDGKVVAVNTSTQTEEWSHAITVSSGGLSCGSSSQGVALYATPAVDESLAYIGAYDGRVYALNIATGGERWIYPKSGYIPGGAIVGSPLLLGDTLYISSSDGRVYALDTVYGELKWKSAPLSEKLWTSPSPSINGDTIYVSTYEGYIYELPTKGGSLNKDVEPFEVFKARSGFVSSPVIYGDTIFVGSFDRNLYAVKIGYDEPLWGFPSGQWFWAAPLVRDGVVYAGCLDDKLYAINATSGKELWEFNTGSPIVASPIFVDNLLVVANESGKVYVFDVNTTPEGGVLAPAKTIAVGAQIRARLCADGSMVYIRGQDNRLYAVDIDRGEIAWEFSL